MKIEAVSEKYFIVYDENFWIGKRSILVNGEKAVKVSRFLFQLPSTGTQIVIKGNFMYGLSLIIDGEKHVLAKNTWYDWLFIFGHLMCVASGVILLVGFLDLLLVILGVAGLEVATINTLRGRLKLPIKIIFSTILLIVSVLIVVGVFLLQQQFI